MQRAAKRAMQRSSQALVYEILSFYKFIVSSSRSLRKKEDRKKNHLSPSLVVVLLCVYVLHSLLK